MTARRSTPLRAQTAAPPVTRWSRRSNRAQSPAAASRPRTDSPRRAVGIAAEQAVRAWLEARGLRVLGSNVRVGYLEVDLLVQDGRTLALVEVRTRSSAAWTSAFGSVDGWKRTRLRRAGERLWNRKFRFHAGLDHVRFDVASVTWREGVPIIEYIRAAF
ncbi:MAG: YraN family protein [Polyangiaceae bacterium]